MPLFFSKLQWRRLGVCGLKSLRVCKYKEIFTTPLLWSFVTLRIRWSATYPNQFCIKIRDDNTSLDFRNHKSFQNIISFRLLPEENNINFSVHYSRKFRCLFFSRKNICCLQIFLFILRTSPKKHVLNSPFLKLFHGEIKLKLFHANVPLQK